jgi:hypothetical protein
MSYRYNTIDIAVDLGMCALLFGALLFSLAANGTYQVALPQSLPSEQPIDLEVGRALLQPALGQIIVDQALSERRADRTIALAVSAWTRATLAHNEFLSRPDGPFGATRRQAVTIPSAHMARVQGLIGRAIVNFTMRGVRTGLLSADTSLSTYNINMIRAAEARRQRLEEEFASTWQATLGRKIVDAAQTYNSQASAIQERLGAAVVAVARAQIEAGKFRATQQEKLGSLVFAAARAEIPIDRSPSATIVAPRPEGTAGSSTKTAAWLEIPLGYLIAASLMLGIVFFIGLKLAVRAREEKELARLQHDASQWVYRMAA